MNKRTIETRRYDVRNDVGKWLGTFVVARDGMLSIRSEYGNYSYWWHSIGNDDFRAFLLGCDDDYLLRKLSPEEEYDGEATEKNVRMWIGNAFQSATISESDALGFEADAICADFTTEFGMYRWLFDTKMPNAHELVIRRTSPQAVLFCKRVWPRFCTELREELAKEAELQKKCSNHLIATIQVIGDSPKDAADELRHYADMIEKQGPLESNESHLSIAHVRPWADNGGEAPLDTGRYWAVGHSEAFPGEQIALFNSKELAERMSEGKPLFTEDDPAPSDMCVTRARIVGSIWNSFDPDPEDSRPELCGAPDASQ